MGGGFGRTFWILVGTSLLTSLGSVPYLVSLLKQIPPGEGTAIATRGALPYLITAIQNLVLTIPTAWVGLRLAPRLGFAVTEVRGFRVGVGVGLAIGVGLLVLSPVLPEIAPKFPLQPAEWWKGLLASASAGVNEEIWFRLGVLTALAAAGMAFARWRVGSAAGPSPAPADALPVADDAPPIADDASLADPPAVDSPAAGESPRVSAGLFWAANAIAALLFGALHLPQADLIAGISVPVVAFVLIGNGIAGLAFGWLYWKYGLISAMVAHFSTDIVLHVIAPLAAP